jgi:hypothetical protein
MSISEPPCTLSHCFFKQIPFRFPFIGENLHMSHLFATLGSLVALAAVVGSVEVTELSVISSSLNVSSATYKRMSLSGTGPQYDSTSFDIPILIVNDTNTPFNFKYINKLNELDATELLHTHGQTPHFSLDGVPYISGTCTKHTQHVHIICFCTSALLSSPVLVDMHSPSHLRECGHCVCGRVLCVAVPLKVNESFSSSFSVFGGTYFVHSHQDFNHDYGVTIPLIVKSATPSSYPMSASMIDNARDAVMFIEDFCPTTDDPVMFPNINTNCDNIKSVYDTLNTKWNAMSSTFNYNECQGGDMSGSGSGSGSSTTSMPGMPGMSHSYRFRVSAPTMPMPMPMPMMMMGVKYKHYLINRRAPSAPSTFKAQVNEVIRLRIINGGSMMDYNITFPPSLSSSVTMISVDGHYIKPKQITSLWMAVGQRADVIITMPSTHDTIHTGVSTMHAQYMNVYLFVCVCVNMHVQVPLVCIQSLQPKKVIHQD